MSTSENVIRIPPFYYIHVIDNNTSISRLEKGPAIFIRKDHEIVSFSPKEMIRLPPRHWCTISNPVVIKDKNVVYTSFGQVKNRFGDIEVRTADQYPDPFPLYPGEELSGSIAKYTIVQQNQAMKVRATRDFLDGNNSRKVGDEWLIIGPFTYIPRAEETAIGVVSAEVIKPNTALRLMARKNCVDSSGVSRKTGEEWLIREPGSYLPRIDEKVVSIVKGTVITDKKALRLRATKDFKDIYGIERRAGEEWLVTSKQAQLHIPDVYEVFVQEVPITTLSNRQYCVILDPFDEKTRNNKWGSKLLRQGETNFFLQPGENLESGAVQNIIVLSEDQALLVQAVQDTVDHEKKEKKAGSRWLVLGPREYIPPIEVRIIEYRKKIPLDENEGIYVRNLTTGEVKVITGKTYLLEAHEELWQKELPEVVEYLIALQKAGLSSHAPQYDANGKIIFEKELSNFVRDKTRVVTYKAPHNSAVQLYDYKAKSSRVVFGPSLVMLGADEQFTLISLSGGVPKRENVIKSLNLQLGPDFMTDVVDVETSDHARLRIQLSYNWSFQFDKTSKKDCEKIFSVKDFIGDACKSVASRIRGAVSGLTFEDFHKKRKDLLQIAVFGQTKDGTPKSTLVFENNGLVINSVDVQNPEPIDPKMRESLFKAQSLNIDITTRTQEMNARHQALRQEQDSKGELDIQKYSDLAKAEEARKDLLLLQAETEAIQSKGKAIADSKAKAESELIEVEAEVNQAKLRAEALRIEAEAENESVKREYDAEVAHLTSLNELEISKAREMAEIEKKKFKELVDAMGKSTIVSMAKSGPESQAKLLKSLGIKGFLINDGKNPINLLNTAKGILGDMKN